MKKLFLMLITTLALIGFQAQTFAAGHGAECAEGDTECMEKQKKKTDEEPECE